LGIQVANDSSTIRSLLPLIEDLRQIKVRRDEAYMAVSLQDSHHARRHAIGHVACLRDRRNETVVFRRQEECRFANVVQPFANVIALQELQTIDVPTTSGMRGGFDELVYAGCPAMPLE